MASVLITGGTGLVGQHLCKKLQERGYDVAILSRKEKQNGQIPTFTWDVDNKDIHKESIASFDYIVHLAGANIGAKRWTDKRKQLIIDSRVKTAQLIYDKIIKRNANLKAFISSSAIGYYGIITSEKVFSETDLPATDFIGKTCKQWEKVADKFSELGIRTVKIRTSVVLSYQGGALSKMMPPIKMGIGSAIGNGKQYLPWIHIDDLCGIYLKAIEDDQMIGAYNAVAPDHKTNKEFTECLAFVLNRPLWFPNIPSIMMKLLFGKMSNILLKGSRISADKIIDAGYSFLFPTLETALIDLLEDKKISESKIY